MQRVRYIGETGQITDPYDGTIDVTTATCAWFAQKRKRTKGQVTGAKLKGAEASITRG